MKLFSWVGDKLEDVHLRLSADADLASDTPSMRSTSGTYMCLSGRNTKSALNGRSKRQTAVAHSTPEAEMASADEALRTEGLPALELWATILLREVKLRMQEDNDACRLIIISGKNPNMRYLNRTHKINVSWIHECYVAGLFELDRCPTAEMEADIMTKPITKADYWRTARLNISIAFDKEASWKEPRPVATPRIAAPATILRPRYLFEFCCGENSKLGIHAGDCIVVRLTAAHDMTSESGLAYALAKVDEAIQADGDILLWSSMPCTGGSPWQNINKRHESARAKIKEHINLFNKLWVSFVKMATYVKSASSHAHIAMEWPKGCSYWRLRKVECFVKEFLPLRCICNGCMVELRSIKNGKLIAKPWSIKTDCIEITEAFAGYTCNHEATMHHPCEGQDTKLSEEYTTIMVNLIHDGYRQATKTACTKTDSPQQDRLKNQIKATALCATTAMSGSGSSSVWQTAAFADREVPWDQWLRTTLRQALQIYFPELTQSFGSGNCSLVETAKMLQVLYSKSASHFMWCSGVKMAPVLAADSNVVPPMREKDVTLSGVKAVIVGDSFLTMLKKVVRKSDGATCERELQEVSGSMTVKVMAEGGAQIRELLRLTKTALEAGN